MLKNVNWEQGFQRLWLVYACLVLLDAILSRLNELAGPPFSPEWFEILLRADFRAGLNTVLWLFVPVVLSKAFQWVSKGFRDDSK
jgi:hypothetical protein